MIMSKYNFDKVYKQNLYVPNWKRGEPEVAKIIGQKKELSVLALGIKKGITASY